jgi:hypothetical protein
MRGRKPRRAGSFHPYNAPVSARRRAPQNRTTEHQPAYLDREQDLAKARWLRDNPEEAAARLQLGDIRTAARLSHVAEQLMDLLEGPSPRP